MRRSSCRIATPKVLRFFAYRVDVVQQENPFLKLNHRVRQFTVYYYTEDNSIRVYENPQVNAGFEQGVCLRRARYYMPGPERVFWHWSNLDIGVDLDLSGHQFHLYDCDDYTRYYYLYNGSTIGPPEKLPDDPYLQYRDFAARPHTIPSDKPDIPPLSRFLQYDGKVLTFEVIMDETMFKAGDVRKMCLKYYIYDDTMELTMRPAKNSGYDPVRTIIKRQKIPKNFYKDLVPEIGDKTTPECYTWKDLKAGQTLLLFGRKVTICDCDEATKEWYKAKLGHMEFPKVHPDELLPQQPELNKHRHSEWHPMHRQGGFEDSMQNCLSLNPQPPKKNDLQAIVYDKEVLRYEARLVTQEPDDRSRRFVFSYFVGDGTVMIMEQSVASISSVKQTFLSRRKLIKEGTSNPPEYYTEQDFTIGSVHFICGRYFQIVNCDEHVVNFALSQPGMYTPEQIDQFRRAVDSGKAAVREDVYVATGEVERDVAEALNKLNRWYNLDHQRIYRLFLENDVDKTGKINKEILSKICYGLGISCEDDIIKGMLQKVGKTEDESFEFVRFLHGVNMLHRFVGSA
ncbi:EF-hand domain-containing protein 1-like isoform X2 [Paramacrobiotus metropolitanus]|uniref:EF-hand domain-containing protein 1-like isoform X2 n=1 Tax=Paramacrobiotus metropolitanus TaxID=2943436 RepID=UPI0024456FD8|nr:EF-hand domain-containing protein 1-like isoform X2 [Paramacrobiotus metropolitanus]